MASGSQVSGLSPMAASLLETGKWSDLEIKCKDRHWRVHKAIICLQSKPLAAAADGGFLESQTGTIDLSDHDPDVVNYMIQFMYTGDYKVVPVPEAKESNVESQAPVQAAVEIKKSREEAEKNLLVHTAVYMLGEEKDIAGLKALSTKRYEALLPEVWNSEAFCQSLELIFEGTPASDRMLWDVAIAHAGTHAKVLMDSGEFVTFWKKHGEIGYEMWKSYIKMTNLPAPPELLKPTGCPDVGPEHARMVVKGRKTAFFCEGYRKAFD
ncbi:uncharacterized protein LY89DRAFT_718381 [Mollisia scopiformis]|uniref:BTB domain-containing protein n=1 Tax=Mollisia scopiformis TaxID=149040 RepID=A0A194XDC1_MOLSC|nr:uncharacterized protein LY89DRAFT_718381 [Mollisia scopiformis]KUJ17752.1 hypothetical protein LY89DRAFT_718381 [Mollisia scopiformis]